MPPYINIPREEYEQRVLHKLWHELMEDESLVERGGRIRIEDVRLDTSGTLHQVHILFRETSRPECLFGYWAGTVEDEEEKSSEDPIVLDVEEGYWGPEDWASTIVITHFEEQVDAVGLGLPPDCDPKSITWINGYHRLPPERARGDEPEPYSRGLEQGEINCIYEEWNAKTERISNSFERRGWHVSWSVDYSVTSSDRVGRDDFRYHIIAYRPVIEAVLRGEQPVFELYDEEREVVAYVRKALTPSKAAELLERYGIPVEEGDKIRAGLPRVPEQILFEDA